MKLYVITNEYFQMIIITTKESPVPDPSLTRWNQPTDFRRQLTDNTVETTTCIQTGVCLYVLDFC